MNYREAVKYRSQVVRREFDKGRTLGHRPTQTAVRQREFNHSALILKQRLRLWLLLWADPPQ
jgi:hypothetical protein